MLQTQVNYWTLMENKRHNLESERLGFESLTETKRHNTVTEGLGFQTLDETKRHNVRSEDLGFANLGETHRHNVMTEAYQAGMLDVAYFNSNSERMQARASKVQADASWQNALTNAARLQLDEKSFYQDTWFRTEQANRENKKLTIEQEKAAAATRQAEASERQAKAAETQATNSALRALSDAVGNALKVVPLFFY